MTAGKSTERPAKPYPEFPLNAHASGQWRKRYKGQTYYCEAKKVSDTFFKP
jgi:hypothetical protein